MCNIFGDVSLQVTQLKWRNASYSLLVGLKADTVIEAYTGSLWELMGADGSLVLGVSKLQGLQHSIQFIKT